MAPKTKRTRAQSTRKELLARPATAPNIRAFCLAEHERIFGATWNSWDVGRLMGYGLARAPVDPRENWTDDVHLAAVVAREARVSAAQAEVRDALDRLRRSARAVLSLHDRLDKEWGADDDGANEVFLPDLHRVVRALPGEILGDKRPWEADRGADARAVLWQRAPDLYGPAAAKPRALAVVSLLCGFRPQNTGPAFTVDQVVTWEADHLRVVRGRRQKSGQ